MIGKLKYKTNQLFKNDWPKVQDRIHKGHSKVVEKTRKFWGISKFIFLKTSLVEIQKKNIDFLLLDTRKEIQFMEKRENVTE